MPRAADMSKPRRNATPGCWGWLMPHHRSRAVAGYPASAHAEITAPLFPRWPIRHDASPSSPHTRCRHDVIGQANNGR